MNETTEAGAGLAALGAVTRETDEANPDPAQLAAQQQQAAVEEEIAQGAKDWGQIMFMLGGAFTLIDERLKPVYSEERCLNWGRHMHAVAEKYHWNAPALPEITLASATVAFAVPTVLCLREKARQIKSERDAGFFGRAVLWWRARKARRAGQAPQAEPQQREGEGAGDGGQQ